MRNLAALDACGAPLYFRDTMVRRLPNENPGPHSPDSGMTAGVELGAADRAIILIHGRGTTAESIVGLTDYLGLPGFYVIAPQAHDFTWYPYSFLESIERNEPGVSSALATIDTLVDRAMEAGIASESIYLLGFSQGACLATEYAARAASRAGAGGFRLGGVFGLSGGLIGAPGTARDYEGSLNGTPVVLGCSDVDMHIPKERVDETAETLARLGAEVDKQIYPGMGHTVNDDEIARINAILSVR